MIQNNFSLSNTNKISKYIIRLKKSIHYQKNNKIIEYYDHLKYHIQLGGLNENGNEKNSISDLTESINSIDTIISNITKNDTQYNIVNDLKKCNSDKIELNEQINKINNELNDLKLKLSESIKQNEEINKIKTKQNEDISSLNIKIDKLNDERIKFENEIKKIENEKNTQDTQLKNIKQTLHELLNISGDVELDLNKELNNIKEKISKYENIIKNILSKTEGVNLNQTGELEKYEKALIDIKTRSEKAHGLENELEIIIKQNEELNKQLKSTEETTKNLELKNLEIENLKNEITSKDIEIKSLMSQVEEQKNKINELENIIEQKSKQIDKNVLEFDNKIKELLNKIYNGDVDLVKKILSGTKLSN